MTPKKDNNGMSKLLMGVLASLVISLFAGGITWLKMDIADLNDDIKLLTQDIKDIKDLIGGSNVTDAELVKDVNINARDIAKNINDIEDLRR